MPGKAGRQIGDQAVTHRHTMLSHMPSTAWQSAQNAKKITDLCQCFRRVAGIESGGFDQGRETVRPRNAFQWCCVSPAT
jgi:hypothetical protein